MNDLCQCADAAQQAATKPPRILIVDDDASIRHLLETLIERIYVSCAVANTENGQHALDLYHHDGADLIITDNDMPLMDGVALIRAIRQDQARVPIIMLSGSPDVRRRAYAAGVTVFLDKPVNIHHLKHAMVEFLPHPI